MSRIPKEKLPEIVARLKAGTSSLGQEAKALGMSYRTTLIMTLREFMGREAYDAMIEAKRPRTKGGTPLGSIERPRPNDAGVPVAQSMKRSDGWTWRRVSEHPPRAEKVALGGKREGYVTVIDGGARILIMIDPDGIEYVQADDNEKADLLRVNPISANWPSIRFVQWEHSKARERYNRQHKHDAQLVEHGRAAAERKRKQANATPDDVVKEQAKHHNNSRSSLSNR